MGNDLTIVINRGDTEEDGRGLSSVDGMAAPVICRPPGEHQSVERPSGASACLPVPGAVAPG